MSNCVCLLYHRVNDNPDMFGISVPVERFEMQMKYLAENYKLVRFEEFFETEEKKIVITFDDGYADNLLNALPILEKYDIPATIFVSSGYVGTQKEYWWDELQRLIFSSRQKSFHLIDSLYDYEWTIENDEDRIALVRDLRHLLRLEPSLARWEEWKRQLLLWSDAKETGRAENRAFTVDELRTISQNSLITIGGHTVSHRSLGGLQENEQKYEIESNLKWLEDTTGKKIEVFSYPFGTTWDYTKETIHLLKAAGIKKAATVERRGIYDTDSEYELPRISLGNLSLERFAEELKKEFEA